MEQQVLLVVVLAAVLGLPLRSKDRTPPPHEFRSTASTVRRWNSRRHASLQSLSEQSPVGKQEPLQSPAIGPKLAIIAVIPTVTTLRIVLPSIEWILSRWGESLTRSLTSQVRATNSSW